MPTQRPHRIAPTFFLLALCFTAWVILFGNHNSSLSLKAQIGGAECNDGVDNDGDGLTDWQFDLSCVAQNDNSERGVTGQLEKAPGDTGAGWTNFEPSADSKIYYVSSSEGNDVNNGLSPQAPLKTITKAKAFLRYGYPDWILLKRGDTWYESFGSQGNLTGRSRTEPAIVASYGSSTVRPLLKLGPEETGFRIVSPAVPFKYVAILGLEIYAYTRDPDSPDFDLATVGNGDGGISVNKRGTTLWIEDNKLSYFQTAIGIQGYKDADATTGEPAGFRDVFVRRNVVHHDYAAGNPISHSQGMFVSRTVGIVVEENVFDHNGWNDTVPGGNSTVFNHNFYLASVEPTLDQSLGGPAIMRGNISARASANCGQMRLGGEAFNNLFLNCPLAMFVSKNDSVVRGNVVIGGGDVSTTPAGAGIDFLPVSTLLVEKNIVANKLPSVLGKGSAYRFTPWGGFNGDMTAIEPTQYSVVFRDNIAWNWSAASKGLVIFQRPNLGPTIDFLNNTLVDTLVTSPVVLYPETPLQGSWTISGNRYFTIAQANRWVSLAGALAPLSAWDPNGSATLPVYPDPTRSVETYMASIGRTPTVDAFLAEARKQSKWGGYRNEFTAAPVNDYIRAGFGMTLTGGSGGGSSSAPTSSAQLCVTLTTRRPGFTVQQAALSLLSGTQTVVAPQIVTVDQVMKKACFPSASLSSLSKNQSYTVTIRGKMFVTKTLTIPNLNSSTPYPVTDILTGDFNDDGAIDLSDLLVFVDYIKTKNNTAFNQVAATATFSDLLKAIIDAIRYYKEG